MLAIPVQSKFIIDAIKRWSDYWSLPLTGDNYVYMTLGAYSSNALVIHSALSTVNITKSI
ncbi:hypothetical protein AHF37_04268 [Paragonimus kellicotti]|nr:hypothetical protein AHF37_04268 [Paragonimus kellicotti]